MKVRQLSVYLFLAILVMLGSSMVVQADGCEFADKLVEAGLYEEALANYTTLLKGETYLFSWDEIPGNDSQRLTNFLKQISGINWVKTIENGTVENGTIDNDTIIKVSNT